MLADDVELPWPGEKRYPHEGWEHIEIVRARRSGNLKCP
ncbi:hypothetical protein CKQ79_29675, partial [Klebsiella pneumoniae]